MTWPFENDTSAITKKIAKNDIDKNRVKKVFSLTTIVFATALLMMLIMFECFLFICCKSSAAIWAASYCRNDTAANKENHPLRKKNFM